MPTDRTIPFSPDDPEMEVAIRTARDSFDDFLTAFIRPSKKQRSFLIKAAFVHGDRTEHIWLADLDLSSKKSRGVVANEPALPGLKFMQVVEFQLSQITDWMYVDDGYLVGGYTTRLIRSRLNPSERKARNATAPYKIRKAV